MTTTWSFLHLALCRMASVRALRVFCTDETADIRTQQHSWSRTPWSAVGTPFLEDHPRWKYLTITPHLEAMKFDHLEGGPKQLQVLGTKTHHSYNKTYSTNWADHPSCEISGNAGLGLFKDIFFQHMVPNKNPTRFRRSHFTFLGVLCFKDTVHSDIGI